MLRKRAFNWIPAVCSIKYCLYSCKYALQVFKVEDIQTFCVISLTLRSIICIQVPLAKRAGWIFRIKGLNLYRNVTTWGHRTRTCGAHARVCLDVNISLLTETLKFSSQRKELMCLITLIVNFNLCNFYSKQRWHVVSKRFSISKNTETVDILLKFEITWSVSFTRWSVVLWCTQKPNWLALNRFLYSTSLLTVITNYLEKHTCCG